MKKKPKTIQFQINDPCHESWDHMHTLPGGRFCSSCEKTVVDFSKMTDNEIVRFMQKNNQKICGSFRPDQLNRDMAIPRIPTSFQKWKSAAAILAGLLSWNAVDAQTVMTSANITPIVKVENQQNEDITKTKSTINILKGIVKDSNGEVLIGATVRLDQSNGTTTGIDGKFELEIPVDWESFEVTFSYIGFAVQVIEFDRNEMNEGKVAEVKMHSESKKITEVVVTADMNRSMTRRLGGLISTVTSTSCGNYQGDIEEEDLNMEKNLDLEISNIYPNPYVDFINVKLEVEKESPYLFHLYNANGQLIWAKTFDLVKGNQELRFDFSSIRMAQGYHFLRVTDGNQEIQTKKLIKVNVKNGEGETLILPNQ